MRNIGTCVLKYPHLKSRWLTELSTRPKQKSVMVKLQTVWAMKRTRELWKPTGMIMWTWRERITRVGRRFGALNSYVLRAFARQWQPDVFQFSRVHSWYAAGLQRNANHFRLALSVVRVWGLVHDLSQKSGFLTIGWKFLSVFGQLNVDFPSQYFAYDKHAIALNLDRIGIQLHFLKTTLAL
jgi:hypothetical protein